MTSRITTTPFALLLLAAITCAPAACQPTSKPLGPSDRLSLRLRSVSDDHRYTYFELDSQGRLSYAGGEQAARREAGPVMTLTADQLQHVRQIVRRHNLLSVPSPDVKKHDHIKYELYLKSEGWRGRTLHATDDTLPGVRELHDYLFSLQAEKRYHIPRLQ